MDGPVCVPNIGPLERRRRRTAGLWALGLAVAMGFLLWGEAPRLYRLVLSPLLLGGFLGVLQARGGT
jgi:hypothetical protein